MRGANARGARTHSRNLFETAQQALEDMTHIHLEDHTPDNKDDWVKENWDEWNELLDNQPELLEATDDEYACLCVGWCARARESLTYIHTCMHTYMPHLPRAFATRIHKCIHMYIHICIYTYTRDDQTCALTRARSLQRQHAAAHSGVDQPLRGRPASH